MDDGEAVAFLLFSLLICGFIIGCGVGSCSQYESDMNHGVKVGAVEYREGSNGDCGFFWVGESDEQIQDR